MNRPKNFYSKTTPPSDVSHLLLNLEIAVNDYLEGNSKEFKCHLISAIHKLQSVINSAQINYNIAYTEYKNKDYTTAVEKSNACSNAIIQSFSQLAFVKSKSIILSSKKAQCFEEISKILISLRDKNNNLNNLISSKTQPEQFSK